MPMTTHLKIFLGVSVFILVACGVALYVLYGSRSAPGAPTAAEDRQEEAVRTQVTGFGAALRMVSLLAPQEQVETAMQQYYGAYTAPELLSQWETSPQSAPGRLTSSPWPERIDVSSVKKIADDTYVVEGAVIEVTSADTRESGAAASYPVIITLQKRGDAWLIVGFQKVAPPSRE